MAHSRFQKLWVAELVRQYELTHGALDDTRVLPLARRESSLPARVLKRAQLLAEDAPPETALPRPDFSLWRSAQRWLAGLLLILAVAGGYGIATATLQGDQPVSLLQALVTLLGLHIIMLLLWLLSLFTGSDKSGIGGMAVDIAQRLSQRSQHAHTLRSAVQVARSQQLLKPLMAVITHSFWTALLVAAWITLLTKLTVNTYAFTWATTILDSESVKVLAQILNWLPALVNYAAPSVESLLTNPSPELYQQAGNWVLVCLAVYGIGVRLLLLIVAAAVFCWRWRNMRLELDKPGMAYALRAVTEGDHSVTLVDADNAKGDSWLSSVRKRAVALVKGKGAVLLSLDFEPTPAALEQFISQYAELNYLGVAGTGAEKQRLTKQLAANPAALVIVRIDANLSPDRGSLRFLEQLKSCGEQIAVWLVADKNSAPQHQAHWYDALAAARIPVTDAEVEVGEWLTSAGQKKGDRI
ncbi:hypothetical protein IDSA_04345 [Pseudidiomarina salinarum]|uniref:DUF2868 domain-containing protein n=1 Tax=Pseudidiomarina salinarum TaxID=435908 RepID=A0A094IW57_9GAMM|nr:DUF2868 domain-containing protein [Pseudidiomarina salinarum]KFZ31915.1 hypothetical protein IDSA_04345 [Pseudidiomarina salinarum]RUO70311.1 DUF2868 domain-containing protein [Pseudidiomarina salinarum]